MSSGTKPWNPEEYRRKEAERNKKIAELNEREGQAAHDRLVSDRDIHRYPGPASGHKINEVQRKARANLSKPKK